MSSINDPIAYYNFKEADLDMLHAAGIRHVRDFSTWTWWRLHALPNMSRKVLDRIDAVLKRFAMEIPSGVPPPRKPATPPDETGRSLCEIANARTKRPSAATRPRHSSRSVSQRTREAPYGDHGEHEAGDEAGFELRGVCAQKRLARCKRVAALIAEGHRKVADIAAAMGVTQHTIYVTLRAPEFEPPLVPCIGCGQPFLLKSRRDRYCSSDCEAAHAPPPPRENKADVRAGLKARFIGISGHIVDGLSAREIAKQVGVSYQRIYQTVGHPHFEYPVLPCRHCGKPFRPTSIGDKLCSDECRLALNHRAKQKQTPSR